MSRMTFVLFSAMTWKEKDPPCFRSYKLLFPHFSPATSLSVFPLFWWVFLSLSALSLFLFSYFLSLCCFTHFLWDSFRERLYSEARRTDGEPWQSSCLWKRKTTLSHFLLFCLKLATGVAYLSRTEILEVGRRCFCNHFLSHHFLKVD